MVGSGAAAGVHARDAVERVKQSPSSKVKVAITDIDGEARGVADEVRRKIGR